MAVRLETLEASDSSIFPEQLPPNIVNELRHSQYFCLAALSAWVWDFLLNFDEEVLLVRLQRQRLSYYVYCAARLFSLLNIVLQAIIGTRKVDNCTAIIKMATCFAAVSMPLSSFLMYCRVRAVYNHSLPIKIIFGSLWLAVAATCSTAPLAIQGTSVGGRCLPTGVRTFGATGILITAINDALIFFAITYRLLTFYSSNESWKERINGFTRGEGLSKLSKSLLQTGQSYYIATVGLYLLGVIGVMSPTLPTVVRAAFTIPTYPVTNHMACKVYRRTRLGQIQDDLSSATSPQSGGNIVSGTALSIAFLRIWRTPATRSHI